MFPERISALEYTKVPFPLTGIAIITIACQIEGDNCVHALIYIYVNCKWFLLIFMGLNNY